MEVLVIPEDFRKDRYILEPIVRAMLTFLGKPRAVVEICARPLLGGDVEALKWSRISEILDLYPMVNLFLLCVDRDGKPGRRDALEKIERAAEARLTGGKRLLAEN